jgi:hypothetical protein
MTSIAIGIYLHSEPERLRATLDYLRSATEEPVSILLLPDGPDAAMRQALTAHPELPQYPTEAPQGAAAAFNRLLRHGDAGLLIFLEAGTLVGPGWLGALLAALRADPRHGIVGPSTNRAWNMQGLFPACAEADIPRIAREAATRFGNRWQLLEPLYCLGDFCYAVRRERRPLLGDGLYRAGVAGRISRCLGTRFLRLSPALYPAPRTG